MTSPAISSANVHEWLELSLVQPKTQCSAQHGGDRDRPADEAHHAQAEPDLGRVALRPELARRLRPDFLGERRSGLRGLPGRLRHS